MAAKDIIYKQREDDQERLMSEKLPLLPCTASKLEEDDALLTKMDKPWYPHLDVTRIFCVCLVVIDHGNPAFGQWNTLLALNWVVQYLYLICGICWAMSSRSLPGYLQRLAMYVVIGVALNFLAWIIAGRDWKHDLHNVIFQFWFVIGLMAYVLLLSPLKPYLASVKRRALAQTSNDSEPEAEDVEPRAEGAGWQRAERIKGWLIIGGGVLGLCLVTKVAFAPLVQRLEQPLFARYWHMGQGASFWGIPTNVEEEREFLMNFCTCMQLTLSSLYIVIVYPLLFEEVSLVSWLVIFNTYGQRILFNRGRSAASERPFHGLDLVLLGCVCYFFGMKHRKVLGELVVRYWFGVLLLVGLLWAPGYHYRFDQRPEQDIKMRMRIELIEMIFIICWLLVGERMVDTRIFSEDKLGFLSHWALLAFLVHQAIHIVCPPPLNWIIIVGLIPIMWLCCRHTT